MDLVLNPQTAMHRYLDVLGAGSVVTIHTDDPAWKGRTNRVAVFTKEPGTWGDWTPKQSEMRIEVRAFPDGAVSSAKLADLLSSDPHLWAAVKER